MLERLREPLEGQPFDREVTAVCKGAALLLLLCHHVFLDFPQASLAPIHVLLGVSGKLCVAVFLLLSGFGLARAPAGGHLFRIVRLLLNFWFVAVPFIALSCLFTDRTFAAVYPNGAWLRFATDMLGLTTGYGGFNPTWWFMGAIVPLYLAYPLLRRLADATSVGVVLLALGAGLTGWRYGGWTLPFALGLLLGRTALLERALRRMTALDALLMPIGLVALIGIRFKTLLLSVLEPFYALAFVFALYALRGLTAGRLAGLWRALSFLGRHSMNVFLLHTFLFAYFFHDAFRALGPTCAVLALLAASLACSVLIAWVKRGMRFDRALGALRARLDGWMPQRMLK